MVQRNSTWGHCKPAVVAEPATPVERPVWDGDPEEGRGYSERYRVSVLQGLKRGA